MYCELYFLIDVLLTVFLLLPFHSRVLSLLELLGKSVFPHLGFVSLGEVGILASFRPKIVNICLRNILNACVVGMVVCPGYM